MDHQNRRVQLDEPGCSTVPAAQRVHSPSQQLRTGLFNGNVCISLSNTQN
jgi:hypothetical protein